MNGYCDLHCHILPGVDDGAQTAKEAHALIDAAYAAGVRVICFTPHYNPLRALASGDAEEVFRVFAGEVAARYPDLILSLGAEILYHQKIVSSLTEGACRTLNRSRFVLVEFLPDDDGKYIVSSLESINARGYKPILAHADRYRDFVRHPRYAFQLAGDDIPIQLNVRSLLGENGRKVKKFCHVLLKAGAVAAIASDAHDFVSSPAKLDEGYKLVCEKYDKDYADALFSEIPRSFLGMESHAPAPPALAK